MPALGFHTSADEPVRLLGRRRRRLQALRRRRLRRRRQREGSVGGRCPEFVRRGRVQWVAAAQNSCVGH